MKICLFDSYVGERPTVACVLSQHIVRRKTGQIELNPLKNK